MLQERFDPFRPRNKLTNKTMKRKVLYNVLAVFVHVVFWCVTQRLGIEFPYAIYWIGNLSGMMMTNLIIESKEK